MNRGFAQEGLYEIEHGTCKIWMMIRRFQHV